MFGIIYIVLSLLAGKELAEILLFTGKNAQEAGSRHGQHKAFCNQIWVLAAAAFGMGTLVFGWTTYMISWAASEAGAKKPLIYGNTAVLIITAVVLVLLYWKRYRKTGTVWTVADRKLISDSRAFRKECILFGSLLVFLTWIMFYVFYIRNGELYSGFSVYGDYAPHTAMMRSFSKGNNFPTEYPHFGGQDVKYHFMFQFLVGNLEFLGIRLDFAYNIESVLALLGFDAALQHCKTTDSKPGSRNSDIGTFFLPQFTFIFSFCDRTSAGKRPVGNAEGQYNIYRIYNQ